MMFAIHSGAIVPNTQFLEAIRTEAIEPEDSGWQIFPRPDGKDEKALVVGLDEVITAYPRLSEIIDSPVGSRFILEEDQWRKVG